MSIEQVSADGDRGRKFVFTLWRDNQPDWDINKVEKNVARYIVAQCERCPKTGKLHWQGYIQLMEQHRITSARKIIGMVKNAGWVRPQAQHATNDDARNYCMKEETRVAEIPRIEYGKFTDGRGDLGLTHMAKLSDREIAEKHPEVVIRGQLKHVRELRELLKLPRSNKTHVSVYYGPPGCGKSRRAYEESPGAYYKMPSNKWWDGYEGEECVIIDDWNYNSYQENRDYWLNLFDRYPMRVETKGGSRQFTSSKIIVTTNSDPTGWDPALLRRVDTLIKMGN